MNWKCCLQNGSNFVQATVSWYTWWMTRCSSELVHAQVFMMTSWNGNIFCITGPLCGNHQSLVNSPHKGQWRRALMVFFICTWINSWVDNREAGDLRCHHTHYDVIVMLLVSDSWRYNVSISVSGLVKKINEHSMMSHSNSSIHSRNIASDSPIPLLSSLSLVFPLNHHVAGVVTAPYGISSTVRHLI